MRSSETPGNSAAQRNARRARLNRIAGVLAERQSEIVVLQEVHRDRSGWGSDDHDVLIRNRLQAVTGRTWYLAYRPNCSFLSGGGTGGQAILSTAPISAARTLFLSANDSPAGGPCRNYNKCNLPSSLWYPNLPPADTIAAVGTTHGVTIAGIHLSSSCGAPYRPIEMQSLLRQLPANPTRTIVAGDFNTTEGTIQSTLLPGWTNHTEMISDTVINPTSPRKIDHVFSTTDLPRIPGTECRRGTRSESDHNAVSAQIRTTTTQVKTPHRVLDTRCDLRVRAGATRCVKVTGLGGVTSAAKAVSVAAVVVGPSGPGYTTVFGQGQTGTSTSTINYGAGTVESNNAIVKVGTGGRVCVRSSAESDILLDVTGVFTSTAQYVPTQPRRERDWSVPANAWSCTRVVGGSRPVPTNAKAVSVNIAVVSPSVGGFITAIGRGQNTGGTSAINFASGQTVANGAVVKVGASGDICLKSTVATRVILDVAGYFPASSSYSAITPWRSYDASVPANAWRCIRMVGTGRPVPSGAKLVAVNVTVVNPATSGFAKIVGRNQAQNGTSNVNFEAGDVKGSMALVKVGSSNDICIRSTSAQRIVIDVVGYSTVSHST